MNESEVIRKKQKRKYILFPIVVGAIIPILAGVYLLLMSGINTQGIEYFIIGTITNILFNSIPFLVISFACSNMLKRKFSGQTRDAVIRRLEVLPEKARRSLTVDNGAENARHEEITEAIGIECYFSDPYASWQRGANEMTRKGIELNNIFVMVPIIKYSIP